MVHRSFPIDNFLYLSLYIFLWSCFHLLPCPIYWFCKYVYLFIFFFRVLIGNKFPPLLRKRWVSPGTVHKNNICFVSDEFLITLKHNLNHNLPNVPNFCRLSLWQWINIILKHTAVVLHDKVVGDGSSLYFQWYSLALDITESRVSKQTISKAKRKATTNIYELLF